MLKIGIVFSPNAPMHDYIEFFSKFGKTSLVLLEDNLSIFNTLILPEALGVSPSMKAFYPKFKIPPYTSFTICSYIQNFFDFKEMDIHDFKNIIALNTSAFLFQNALNRKLNFKDNLIYLTHNNTNIVSYTDGNSLLTINTLENSKQTITNFLNRNDGQHFIPRLDIPAPPVLFGK